MSSRLDAIRRVVDAFERSDWSEIDIATGGIRVHLAVGARTHPPTDPAPRPEPETSIRPSSDGAALAERPRDVTSPAHGGPAPPAGAHVVVSPSPGIFWRSPQPGAPHFADVGDTVEASTTVCIVEVMKLMNHVKAGVAGTVVAVYGENGVAVGLGAPLFAIVPDETTA